MQQIQKCGICCTGRSGGRFSVFSPSSHFWLLASYFLRSVFSFRFSVFSKCEFHTPLLVYALAPAAEFGHDSRGEQNTSQTWGKIAYAVQSRVVSVWKWRSCAIRLSISLISSGRFSATIRRLLEKSAEAHPLLRSVFISPRICGSHAAERLGAYSCYIESLPKHFSKTRPLTATLREKAPRWREIVESRRAGIDRRVGKDDGAEADMGKRITGWGRVSCFLAAK